MSNNRPDCFSAGEKNESFKPSFVLLCSINTRDMGEKRGINGFLCSKAWWEELWDLPLMLAPPLTSCDLAQITGLCKPEILRI